MAERRRLAKRGGLVSLGMLLGRGCDARSVARQARAEGWRLLGAIPIVVALFTASCAGSGVSPESEEAGASFAGFPRCEADPPRATAPPDWYRDEPIYGPHEQPREPILAWARKQPGFQESWIDWDHNGWITLAFNHPVEGVQRELESRFPDAGVVAVEVDWTMDTLWQLRPEVRRRFPTPGSPPRCRCQRRPASSKSTSVF